MKLVLIAAAPLALALAVVPTVDALADGERAPVVRSEAKRTRTVVARRAPRVAALASDAYLIQDKPGTLDEFTSGPEARCKYVFGVPFAFCGPLQQIVPEARGPKLVGAN